MAAKPTLTKQGQEAQDARRRRQAEALRANLTRRKAKGRAQTGLEGGADLPAEAADSKGPATKPGHDGIGKDR